ncbi:ATP-dependent helicase [Peptostreptococcus canis]|uniref:DNA 3'-5' helicase n=1 Tax=Peptostreptococcus canis TaxID=1159213 RepID=A0ABR6TJN6_9FIRM|nr:ATP-dependent helicase [Peptostreptococcus canis]MBC2575358.1 ATP-dependent helicase [Peptostreptococcus canis]MBP1997459.1 DNA helicase-2/ATP-dependent DNA helicase PcrA [Peptostreptococcus canis]
MQELNNEQKKAVEHLDGPCLVLAGPGSGKTRVIAHRIVNLVVEKNIPPTRILAISFTKVSSLDIKKKTIELSNDDRIKKVNFGTFHSIFFRILRRYDNIGLEDLISENDRYQLMKIILKQNKITNFSEDDIGEVLSEISYVKNELMNAKKFKSSKFDSDVFENIYNSYENGKNKINKIDFDDMLIKTYEILFKNEEILNIIRQVFRYILIDEFQDINKVQFEIIKLIAHNKNNLFVVGDEDQSIYGFRGSRPDFMVDFSNYFENAKKIFLKKNYRSKRNIISISQNLISKNTNRYKKTIIPEIKQDGDIKIQYSLDIDDEAKKIASEIKLLVEKGREYSDFAIIYRTNRQSRAFVDVFMDNRIPFILKDVPRSIYDHWVSLDLIAYLKVAVGISSNDDWARIINKPYRYISKSVIKKAIDSDDFFEYLIKTDDIKSFQKKDLEDLYEDLNYIKGLAPEYAISYIRSTLDYDRYILEYCHDRKIKSKQIIEVMDEFEISSKGYKTILDFFKHISEVKVEIKKRTENKVNNSMNSIMSEGVILTTMHSAKGLEFKNVYVVGVNEGTIPFNNSEDIEDMNLEEERRLMYVAVTRAKESLTISIPQKKFNKKINQSRFIKELYGK